MKLNTQAYGGWSSCYQLSNGKIELIIPSEIGIRVMFCGLVGSHNEFCEHPDQMGKTGGDEWRLYGGHRLWHAPEHPKRTYEGDNQPITLEEHGDFIRLIQQPESTTGIQKEMDISLVGDKAQVKVVHRLKNHNQWAVELAPWSLSVMAAGGVGILPLPPAGSHAENLLPTRRVNTWAYTQMNDPRWTWGAKYILLRQDTSPAPQKVGLSVSDGWGAYVRQNHLFLTTFQVQAGANYPDHGSTAELFTNHFMLEVETLAPLTNLAPQASVEHTENWFIFDGVATPQNDTEVDQWVLPLAQQALAESVWG